MTVGKTPCPSPPPLLQRVAHMRIQAQLFHKPAKALNALRLFELSNATRARRTTMSSTRAHDRNLKSTCGCAPYTICQVNHECRRARRQTQRLAYSCLKRRGEPLRRATCRPGRQATRSPWPLPAVGLDHTPPPHPLTCGRALPDRGAAARQCGTRTGTGSPSTVPPRSVTHVLSTKPKPFLTTTSVYQDNVLLRRSTAAIQIRIRR